MRARPGSEVVNRDSRQRLTSTAIEIAVAIAAGTVLATSALGQTARELRAPSPYVAIQNEPAPRLIVAAATSADQIEHHIAKIDGTRFHYVTAGTGDPVLLIPGWPESWIAWRKVLPLLVSAGRRVVVLDPRGFGESDKPVEVTISTRPHATCMVSLKRPIFRPQEESTSSPMTSGRGSRTPTPRIIQRTSDDWC